MQGERFRSFAGAKPQLHDDCRECPWLTLCYGECPKYRVMNVGEAENSLPFFCDSFKMFFEERYVGIEEVRGGLIEADGPGGARRRNARWPPIGHDAALVGRGPRGRKGARHGQGPFLPMPQWRQGQVVL